MKKLISLLLCALMLVSLSIPAFAASASENSGVGSMSPAGANKPEAEVQSTCINHSWGYFETVYNGYVWRSNSTCALEVCHRYRCNNCNVAPRVILEYMDPASHSGALFSASCDGHWQTWTYDCKRCNSPYNEMKICPNKGHQGPCTRLPV